MKKKYKLILLLSNIALFFFVLNKLSGIISFENESLNLVFIGLLCLLNIVIAIAASIDVASNK
ncbi:MAG: hypothetical protein QMB95_05495 [Polaribacter sp.]|jgi:hypothetical protein|uniref:hypothetical protein n=1 Tax=uncultured Polaribacter sp. TaxID=174711 RepID=UPI0030D8842C|tara:strand:+ start:25 stop:213 length:189 start_codon:yes stop_codon:yes gene_type:complete